VRPEKADLSRMKFLVVDDSQMARSHIASLLKGAGANRVDEAENGKDALLKIKKSYTDGFPYTPITLDWEMPEMSGLDLLRELRGDDRMKGAVVLMISSQTESEKLRAIAPLKPSGFIVKPFADEALLERVLGLLAGKG
jgi:two-component system, chemotaxis family, chemotaxis protein CheY